MFGDALRAMRSKDLQCPACGEVNMPKAKPTVEIDQTGARAHCAVCSYEGAIGAFRMKETS